MDKTDFLLEDFKNIQDLIKFADQKAAAILVVCGIILSVFMEFTKPLSIISIDTLSQAENPVINISIFLTGLILSSLLLVILCICIFKVLKPKFANHYSENSKSMFYFEHIAKMEKSEFIEMTNSLSEDTINNNLSDQIYEISKILLCKNKYCALTMNLLFAAIVDLFLFVLTSNLL